MSSEEPGPGRNDGPGPVETERSVPVGGDDPNQGKRTAGTTGTADSESGVPGPNDSKSAQIGLPGAVGIFGTSLGVVILIGVFLFAVSGVWPPLVAIESESMSPNIETGDMVFIMAADRFPPEAATHGVVTAQAGAASEHRTFGQPGDVIVFAPNGNDQRTPVIHRAMFWVDSGENWYDRADPDAIGTAESCTELRDCPAPHSGFVTKGDFNNGYDQATGTTTVVRPEWVIGTGVARVPSLGWIRLVADGQERVLTHTTADTGPQTTEERTDVEHQHETHRYSPRTRMPT